MGASSLTSAAPQWWPADELRMASSSCGKVTPPASGVPVPGKADGSQTVQVDGEVDRLFAWRRAARSALQGPAKSNLCIVGVGPAKLNSARSPLRMQNWWMRSVAHQLMAAAEHAGVAELRAQVVVPQVGVGVKVDDV